MPRRGRGDESVFKRVAWFGDFFTCLFYFISTVTYLFLVWLSIGRTIFSLILVTLFNKIKEKEGGGA